MIREVVAKATGDIITVAGNGNAGYSGDGGPATAAELDGPRGLALDAAGDLFFADREHVVREVVKATGEIITVAGNGTGYSGDGGPATAAELGIPMASPSTPPATCSSPTSEQRGPRGGQGDRRHHHRRRQRPAGYSGDGGPATDAEAERPSRRRRRPAGRPVHRRHDNNVSARWSRRPATSSPSPATASPATAATAGPPPTPNWTTPGGVAVDSAGDLFIADL